MIAKIRGQMVRGVLCVLVLWGVAGVTSTLGQLIQLPVGRGASRTTQAQNQAQAQAAAAQGQGQTQDPGRAQPQAGQPRLETVRIPVNPNDPIAIINNEIITRAQLADECVSRKGEEILETLIARKLIEQALRARKLEVTAAEIDQEIDNVAMKVGGLGREAWLRTLDKERGISPMQYARDIIYPALALRKLAASKVQVTTEDMQKSFAAQYGDKLRVRMIMVDKLQAAREIWEELRKNPGGFEKLAQDRSMDSGSRSLGGLLAEPISRFAYPETVSKAAFDQLVDGDPKDKDPSHKPKDGDITGPIQVAEATWIVLRREGVIPGRNLDPNDPQIKKQTYELIYEVKLKEAMGEYMVELMRVAAIENKLTGKTKEANQALAADKEIQLMGGRPTAGASSTATVRQPQAAGSVAPSPDTKTPTPAALSPDVAKQAESLSKPLAPRK
jgi:foldase protein PrsA